MSMTELLFSFKGRLNRKPYWLGTIAIIVIVIVLVLGAIILDEDAVIGIVDAPSISGLLIVLLILYIPLALIGLALAAKRLHDPDKSAWWVIVFYVIPTILNFIGDRAGGAGIILSLI